MFAKPVDCSNDAPRLEKFFLLRLEFLWRDGSSSLSLLLEHAGSMQMQSAAAIAVVITLLTKTPSYSSSQLIPPSIEKESGEPSPLVSAT